jgi:hypothetical protein
MLDGGRMVGGLAIALVVVAGPAWLGSTRGAKIEALAKPIAGERCIEPGTEMRKSHPALLADWRDRVVRFGDRVHEGADGRAVRISLTGTCLGCHGKASEFCDRCHAQVAVTLSCWQCHAQSAR